MPTDKQRIQQLERAVRFAMLHIQNPPGLIFSQRNKNAVLNTLGGVLDGVVQLSEQDCVPRLRKPESAST